jgi:anti-sigma regulatory factor (Ser/Thr protein kinase)
MKREFSKDVNSLTGIFDFLAEYIRREGIAEEFLPSLHLAVEEIFVNLVRYNTDSRNDVSIELSIDSGKLSITMCDRDVQEYDITKREEVDINRSLEQRRPGGLGIHFVRQIMDDIQYDYTGRTSTITLIKELEENDAEDTLGQ